MIKHLAPRSKKELLLKRLPKKIVWAIITSPFGLITGASSLCFYPIVFAIMMVIGFFLWAKDDFEKWDDFWMILLVFPGIPFMWYLKSVWHVKTFLD